MIQNMSEWLELETKMAFKTTLTAFPADNTVAKMITLPEREVLLHRGRGLCQGLNRVSPAAISENAIHSKMLEV